MPNGKWLVAFDLDLDLSHSSVETADQDRCHLSMSLRTPIVSHEFLRSLIFFFILVERDFKVDILEAVGLWWSWEEIWGPFRLSQSLICFLKGYNSSLCVIGREAEVPLRKWRVQAASVPDKPIIFLRKWMWRVGCLYWEASTLI